MGTTSPKWIRKLILSADKCYYCERLFGINPPIGAGQPTTDHIIPRKHGGVNNECNVIAACSWCNEKKGSKTLNHFYKFIEKFRCTEEGINLARYIQFDLILANISSLQTKVAILGENKFRHISKETVRVRTEISTALTQEHNKRQVEGKSSLRAIIDVIAKLNRESEDEENFHID